MKYYIIEEEDFEQRIAILRQWLNEERITKLSKMVSSDELKHFLTYKEKIIST